MSFSISRVIFYIALRIIQVHRIEMQLYINVFTVFPRTSTPSSRCRAVGRKKYINAFYSLYLFILARIILYRGEIVIIARLDQLSAYIMIAVCIQQPIHTHTHFAVVFAVYRYTILIEGGIILSSRVFFSKTRQRRKNTSCAARVSDKNLAVRHSIEYPVYYYVMI